MFLFGTMICNATVDTTGVDPNVKYLTEQIGNTVNTIADELHVQPDMVYQALEKQVYVEQAKIIIIWLVTLVLFIVSILCIFFIHRSHTKWLKNKHRHYDLDMGLTLKWVFSCIVWCTTMILVIMSICNMFDYIQLSMNPEYWILQQIIL